MPLEAHIHGEESPAGRVPGLRFDLRGRMRGSAPRLLVEATADRLIVSLDGTDHLFARVHPHLQGLHVGVAPHAQLGALPAILADDLRAAEHHARAGISHPWARWFIGAIARSSLLSPGSYAMTEASDGSENAGRLAAGGAPPSLVFLDPVSPCLDRPSLSWHDWFGDDRDVLRLRTPSATDAARVKAWRKRAREGRLPPLLLWFVSGLDTCVLIDGHDRLLAAREEDVAPRLLVLWRCSPRPRSIDVARQEGLLGELRTRHESPTARRPALGTEHENALLREAFPHGVRLAPTTRASALRGGKAAFERRAHAALGADIDERFLSGREPAGEARGCSAERCGAHLGWLPGT